MKKINIIDISEEYLHHLCLEIPTRRVGSKGNQDATQYFSSELHKMGYSPISQKFDCIDWEENGAELTIQDSSFPIHVSPYSLACDIESSLVCVKTKQELETSNFKGKILLLLGKELCGEQLMPKEFPFYNPAHHKTFIALLESKKPAAILTATGKNPELAGSMYPFPLIEDGDFDIPTAYLKDTEGEKLSEYHGKSAKLIIRSKRLQSHGENIILRLGPDDAKKVVITAHIDAKDNSPGALDNATGVVVLLLLAELLKEYKGENLIELVALNGEDHYSSQGQKEYLKSIQGEVDRIMLTINMDGAGFNEGKTAYSLYNCAEEIKQAVKQAFIDRRSFIEGEQWYQSDHSIFIQQGISAMAITSENFSQLSAEITHTSKDHPDIVDKLKMVEIARSLFSLLTLIN
jgi:aminopeptidase YwaD